MSKSYNRTNVELKLGKEILTARTISGYNRTNVELKCFQGIW